MRTQFIQQPSFNQEPATVRGAFSGLFRALRRAIAGEELQQLEQQNRSLQIAVQTAIAGAPVTPPEVELYLDQATHAVREAQIRQDRWQEDQARVVQEGRALQEGQQGRLMLPQRGNGTGEQNRYPGRQQSHLEVREGQGRGDREETPQGGSMRQQA